MTPSQPSRGPQGQPRSNAQAAPKPYGFVPFPSKAPNLKNPQDLHGHDRYRPDRLHGKLTLKLTVKTAVHISTGIVARGQDVGDRVPLIKTMAQGQQQQLTIPGSSLKGVVRSVFEAITNSTLAVATGRERRRMPQERLPCNRKETLCPASLVFGALNWQGVIHFTDATCEAAKSSTGFMPSLYRPRPDQSPAYFHKGRAVGRKFYYHAVRAVSGGDRGIPVQQAGTEYGFRTTLQFMNLSAAEVGTLLIALGQDPEHPLALKVGGGKPIGMGTMTIEVVALEKPDNLKARYTTYELPESDRLTEQALQQWMEGAIAAAHRTLIEKPQLEALVNILKWPTTRTAPEGMY